MELRGLEGYIKFSDKFMSGRMQKAYQLVSAACKYHDLDFKALGWPSFKEPPRIFIQLVEKLLPTFLNPRECRGV